VKQGLFITGTGTGVGKTIISALLISALKQAGRRARYFKPVQTGSDDDTAKVVDLSKISADEVREPLYKFVLPAAPLRAAENEGKKIHLDAIAQCWQSLPHGDWIIEGVGGILVPITRRETVCELIEVLQVPIIVVATTQLGTINHTLLTLETAKSRHIPVRGIVLLGRKDPGLRETIEQFTTVPVVAEVPWLDSITTSSIEENSRRCFPSSLLDQLFFEASQ